MSVILEVKSVAIKGRIREIECTNWNAEGESKIYRQPSFVGGDYDGGASLILSAWLSREAALLPSRISTTKWESTA